MHRGARAALQAQRLNGSRVEVLAPARIRSGSAPFFGRTLHYYDQIGLARPSSRSAAGYRLYTDGDLAVLQRVAFYRELGLELGDIAEILAAPDAIVANCRRAG